LPLVILVGTAGCSASNDRAGDPNTTPAGAAENGSRLQGAAVDVRRDPG
jgi:hypothetical protein